ncbi:fatty acid synthase, partial [Trichonephila clavata]
MPLPCLWIPSIGLESLAEMFYKNYETLPVVFEDIAIHRATIIPKTGKITFVVYITYVGKKFEISAYSIVCTGRVNFLEEMERKDLAQCFNGEEFKNLTLNTNDVYKELKMRGYEYGPNFQGIIGAEIEGNKGLSKWTGEWVVFLDSLLQFLVLHLHERALSLPTRIQKLSIDPVFHKMLVGKYLKEYQ